MKWMTNSRMLLLLGIAFAVSFGLSLNAQAQTCVVTNWAGGQNNLVNSDAGTPIDGHSRYAGPCSLEVEVDGTTRSVTDNNPSGSETDYIVRFYFLADGVGSDPVKIYSADGGGSDRITLTYTNGDLTLAVDDGGVMSSETVAGLGAGWHSVEFVWTQDANATIQLSVDGAADVPISGVDSSGYSIDNALLGNLDGVNAGGTFYFDDYDSRRSTRPGRLCRGDVNESGSITQTDMLTIFNEVASGGTVLAGGQPDYNENGSVTQTDFLQVLNNHVSIGVSTCP